MEQNIQEPKKTTILIEDLYKSYGEKEVLLGLNLEVHEGELFGFIGRNGIGKSTTIDCMIGAKKFNKGRIELNGYDIVKDPIDAKKSLGYVASEPTCYEEMTGYDYLEFVASIYGMTEGDFRRNSEYLCNRLQLNLDELNNPISDYSHGMKQKLCLVASHNNTVFVTSHNIELVSKICDKVAIINDGKVVALYDLNKNPNKRLQLSKIFLDTYGG